MPTDSFTLSALTDGVNIANVQKSATDNFRLFFSMAVPTGTTNLLLPAAFALDDLTSFYVSTDQAITIDTNAVDGTGGNVFTLAANDFILWQAGSAVANPLTHDVTAIYVNNASGKTANVRVTILVNAE